MTGEPQNEPSAIPAQQVPDPNVEVVGTIDAARMQAFALGAAGALYRIERMKARWAREDARTSVDVGRDRGTDAMKER